ncbi:hypothetical protein [Actinokineospora fastidiosa]|uniref:Uncharacterized protein n=1 Tax=Actinokineospora fastidiosa TaxID=1816 RepID=A0A918GUY8_9PSEU|nr:hypothetical protein [Actinokineospora fastidiosa]GGS60854.1 hypothetical protein GCM10010171_64690 [Actinokineospora fastidiosa]
MEGDDTTNNEVDGTVHGDVHQIRDVHGSVVFGPRSTPPPTRASCPPRLGRSSAGRPT